MKDSPILLGGVTWSWLGLPLHEWAALFTIIFAIVRIIAWLPEAGKSLIILIKWSKEKLKSLFGKA